MSTRRRSPCAEVVSLADVRERRRLYVYRDKTERVLEANQRAISRLHDSAALFTKEGARAGRDLLLAHQHLLRVVTVLTRLADEGEVPAPRTSTEIQAAFRELDFLLEKTNVLTTRTGEYLARITAD